MFQLTLKQVYFVNPPTTTNQAFIPAKLVFSVRVMLFKRDSSTDYNNKDYVFPSVLRVLRLNSDKIAVNCNESVLSPESCGH